MKEHFKKFYGKSLYLLLAAIFLFAVAFFLNTYFVSSTTSHYYARQLQKDIIDKEKDFQRLTKDTALIRSIINRSYSETVLYNLLDKVKGYTFFIYETELNKSPDLIFWNTQTTLPQSKRKKKGKYL